MGTCFNARVRKPGRCFVISDTGSITPRGLHDLLVYVG